MSVGGLCFWFSPPSLTVVCTRLLPCRAGVSGLFIVANLKQTIYAAAPARALLLLGIMLGLHMGVGLALRLYFFRYRGVPETAS